MGLPVREGVRRVHGGEALEVDVGEHGAQTRWALMAQYHPTENRQNFAYSKEADDEVVEEMENDAMFQKYLGKAA